MTADVTIVLATYNRPAYLREELESLRVSIARVPSVDVRVVVVDDASKSMAAREIARDFGADYIRHPRNLGTARTLLTGFEAVDSPIYALWGDDDFFLPRFIELHLAKLAEGFDVVAGSYYRTDAALRKRQRVVLPVTTVEDLMQGDVRCNDGAFVRRDSLGEIAFRPERELTMMMTFWLAMAHGGRRFGVVEEPTWLYRRHRHNLSDRPGRKDEKWRREAIADYL